MPLPPDDRSSLRGLAVVLYAHNPGLGFCASLRELAAAGFAGIIVVDDGSGPGLRALFEEAGRIEGVTVFGNTVEAGHAESCRGGINQALYRFPEITGVVTATAEDRPAEILRVAMAAARHPDAMVFGARPASTGMSQRVLRLLAGTAMTHAPRTLPATLARDLLERITPGDDFELDTVVAARDKRIVIVEERLESAPTAAPGRNPLASLRAWMSLLRFGSVSVATVFIDVLAFYLALRGRPNILVAQVIGRIVASVADYAATRRASLVSARYLARVAADGTVSYLLIRLIFAATQGRVTIIKIGVEAVLLAANFALQRDGVFAAPVLAGRDAPASPQRARLALSALLWALLLAPLAAEYYGFRDVRILRQVRWIPDGEVRFRNYTLAFMALTFAGLYARRWLLPALSAAVVACTIYAVGFAPAAAVLLFVFSATVLGRLVLRGEMEGPLAFLAGTSLWIAALYATATLPIHYPGVYLAALAMPMAAGYRQTRGLALEWLDFLRPVRVPAVPEYAASAGLAFILIASWLTVLKPEASTDGLAMHFNIAVSMALHHAYTIDFHKVIWALMPIGGDFCYAVLYIIGGEYAARLLNFAMLVAIAALMFGGARRFVSRPVALLLAVTFVSTPMVYMVTGSLMVENFVAAMVLGGLIALWRFRETHATRYLMLTGVLFGTSIGLKLGAVAAGLIGLVCLGWEVWRSRRGPQPVTRRAAFAAMIVLILLGSIPYVKAWRLTGNPLFPFETAMFKSPLLNGRDVVDTRYNHPVTWRTPYQLTFHTDSYHEGQPGGLGFQYLLFLPLTVAGFFALRSRQKSFQACTAILIGGVSALIIAETQSNARYFYFALPPLLLGAAAALAWVRDRQPMVYRAAVAAGLAAAYFNVWFLPCADWYHRGFYSAPLFSAAGREAYLHTAEGAEGLTREVVDWINRHNTTKPVVFTDSSETTGLIAPAYANNWHNYSFNMQVQFAPRAADVYQVFARDGIGEMVVDRRNTDRQDAVTQLISACGVAEFVADPFIAMKLRPDCPSALQEFPIVAATCVPGEALPPGTYDETDRRIAFGGKWQRTGKFTEPYEHTIAFSNVPGAVACFAMNGTGFDYIHASAFNRGRAEVRVDGEKVAQFDLYDPKVVWQSHSEVRGLTPGRHVVTIEALPEKSAAATDFYIDLDGVVVY